MKKAFMYLLAVTLFVTYLPVSNANAQVPVSEEKKIDLINEIVLDNNLHIEQIELTDEIEAYVLPLVPLVVSFIVSQGLKSAIKKFSKNTIKKYIKEQEKVAKVAAEDLGYKQLNDISHGARVYQRVKGSGPKYISRDVDSHSGGSWKGATTIKNLGSPNTRSGTYDVELEYMKK
ncbi:toxin C-terminal domain-containing protein [Sporosarcina sp. FSL K6-5500]|uniref:toxin C-terminal domain-containing protein n=1 Tax=Sporosarcina sp. FSL K6-5500 TaxID=2921558 RepID=UPI0030FA956E